MSQHDGNEGMGALLEQRLARLTPQQRELLQRRLAAQTAQHKPATPLIRRRAEGMNVLPQSPAQQRIWFFERLQPGTGAYHLNEASHFFGALNLPALQQAFQAIIQRHEALRTGFAESAGVPQQYIHDEALLVLNSVDLSAIDADRRLAEVHRRADQEIERPFDLARPPLLRATVFKLAEQEHVLLIVQHHIVADDWSGNVLLNELKLHYNALCEGRPLALPEQTLQFPDVVLWQQEVAQQQNMERQMRFWTEALADTTGLLDLPTDFPRSSAVSLRGRRWLFKLPEAISVSLKELAKTESATLFMVMLSGFQALLARYSGQQDIVIGTPVANRSQIEFEDMIGLFANTLALRGDLSGQPSFRQLLARTRAHVLLALSHADAPLERVVDALQLERAPGRTPLFQTMFVMQQFVAGESAFHGLQAGEFLNDQVTSARFELTLSLTFGADGIDALIDYNTDLFAEATIARMARHFEILLQAACAAPDRPLHSLDLFTDAERRQVLQLGNGGPPACIQSEGLFGLFAEQARRSPDAIALLEPGNQLSYRQLLQRSFGLAKQLRQLGAGPETAVGVLVDRSAESIVALLGILAAGAAYVPLDPGHPDERIAYMLGHASVLALVAPPALAARAQQLASRLPCVVTDTDCTASQAPGHMHDDGQMAYIIYTSGSTGTPKGVVIEHQGAVNLVQGFLARHDFVNQRLLMIPPLMFDASVGDVFPVLACGATLVLHPHPTELGPFELERFCHEFKVSGIDAPAALWRRWSEGWASQQRSEVLLPQLRLMMIGGESVPLEQVRRFAAITDHRVTLTNHYGPTETSVCATLLSTCDAAELHGTELPIGRPLPGVRLYVVDEHLQLQPRGVVGELAIAGAGVARGYLSAAELTSEKFVLDPYAERTGERMYRTGDLVRWDTEGNLQFLGRRDHQVKLRGFRIELGELETALAACPGVSAAVALLREDRPGDRRLVAYVLADAAITTAVLREYLVARLPEAMLPSAYVFLDALPLTANGKVDRKALPIPAVSAAPERELVAPTTATESQVLGIWQSLLARQDISSDDEFFAIGGDSLMTLPLVFKLHACFGIELALTEVFAAPTVKALAAAIDQRLAGIGPEVLDLAAKVQLPAEIDPVNAEPCSSNRSTPSSVLLTGATGFLGAYLLRELLERTSAEILCLVRADDVGEAHLRLRKNMESYGLWRAEFADRLVPVPGDFAAPALGLSSTAFTALAARAEVIFHNGGQVNFLAPYQHLEAANVNGTREVLRLATLKRVKPVHLISTLGVYLTEDRLGTTVRESDAPPRPDSQHGGYNQSKWVAEQLGLLARARGLPVAIYRPARITGDSRSGCGNLGDYFCSWIKGCVQLGMLPHIPGDAFDMAPVDYVAAAIVRLALGAGEANGNFHFHNAQKLALPDLLSVLREQGLPVAEVDYSSWYNALMSASTQARASSSAEKNALSSFAALFPAQLEESAEPEFDCSATSRVLEALGLSCPPADRQLFTTYVRYMQQHGFLPQQGLYPGEHQ